MKLPSDNNKQVAGESKKKDSFGEKKKCMLKSSAPRAIEMIFPAFLPSPARLWLESRACVSGRSLFVVYFYIKKKHPWNGNQKSLDKWWDGREEENAARFSLCRIESVNVCIADDGSTWWTVVYCWDWNKAWKDWSLLKVSLIIYSCYLVLSEHLMFL